MQRPKNQTAASKTQPTRDTKRQDTKPHLNIQSPGFQIHSYNKHEPRIVLFKNQRQESRWISSNTSATSTATLLKTKSFWAFHTAQIKEKNTLIGQVFLSQTN
jgi:hypothetical protein